MEPLKTCRPLTPAVTNLLGSAQVWESSQEHSNAGLMPGFNDPRGFFQSQQFHISVITSPSKPFPERADLQTEAPSAQLLRRILIQQRERCLREERDLMSKLNKCTMLSSHWQIGWILMALPLELAFSRELCSHQPCADQHISNRGTHAPSYASPPHSSLLPVSFLKGIVLLFWQKSSCPLGIHWKKEQ